MTKEEICKLAEKVAHHGTWIHPNGETAYTFYEEHLVAFANELMLAITPRLVPNNREDSEWKTLKKR